MSLLISSLSVAGTGLSEWYSPVVPGSGLHPRPADAASLKHYFPEVDPSWSSIWYPPRKGEGVDEVLDRIDGFVGAFQGELERRFPGKHQRVLFVSHAAIVIALGRTLLRDRKLPTRVGCCTISEFVRDPENIALWKAGRLADGSHLKDGAQREWGFQDIEVMDGQVGAFQLFLCLCMITFLFFS